MNWHHGRLAGFDTETTGTSIETDRIVTACVVQVGGGEDPLTANWLTDVDGHDIPEEATAVHGITTTHAHTHGIPAAEAIADTIAALTQVVLAGVPVVAMNAAFDFSILDREARRHGIPTLTDVVGASLRVIDPRVLDKQVDRYRRGGRTLTDLCTHYEVALDGAHAADADALAACRVAWRIAQRHPRIAAMSLDDLHEAQTLWHAEQAAGLRDYFAATAGKEHLAASVRDGWPLTPFEEVPA